MKRTERNKNNSILFKILVPVLLLIIVIGAAYGTFTFLSDDNEQGEESESGENTEDATEGDSESDGSEDDESEENGEAATEPETTEISISTVGDIMAHDEQYWGAYVEETDSYDFKPVFEHVKPYLEEADLAIGNFETTVAGEDRGYAGFPLFNTCLLYTSPSPRD